MIIHEGYENLDLINPVVTLGIFDGVHKGHKTLLDKLVSRARETKGESVVVTFDPHPRLVLSEKHEGFSFLTTFEEKTKLLEKAMIDHLIIIEFNQSLSNIEACDFVRKVLVEKIGTKQLIVGYDHHFGKQREGNYKTISQCAELFDFKVEQVREVSAVEGAISSSSIREALLNGKLDDANRWLGYDYSLKGTIVEGRKLGRSIGFPTANIKPDDKFKLIPGNGVYAVEVQLDGKLMPGMLSIGSNPTVNKGNSNRSIEVNIFNFEKDIYGREISIAFRYRLRDEVRFDDIRQLVEQMKLDKQHALRLLA
jgi:riboflavin kinase/FMN adenylyltransferase